METTKELVSKKEKRPKSATRYPKRMPTYVVAFAVQESRDDPKNSLTPSKRSSENSATSVNPISISPAESTNSTKTFTITPTEKLSHVLSIPTISEVKIDIKDDTQYGNVEQKSPQISSYIVVDNITVDEQPEVIFNASKHNKRSKDNNKFLRKKPKKNKRVIKFKNIHLKYKNPKNSISRRLENYYEKINFSNSEQIHEQISSDGLLKVVCKSRDLKKVLAKENLLDDSDRISLNDGFGVNEYEDGSPASSPSTTKKSFVSYTSQDTLVHKSSSSSRNEDFYSIKTANSVIQVSSEVMPYKNDVINVAVAVAFNSSKPNSNQNDSSNSNEIFMHKENLTSDETFLLPYVDLTSGTPSHVTSKYIKNDYNSLNPITLDEKDLSSDTLTGFEKKSVGGVGSDDDTFVIARTSSDFNKSSINSEFTLTSNSDSTMRPENLQPDLNSKDEFVFHFPNRTTLSDTVKSLGFYPGMAPSTSYDANFKPKTNDVIVTENLMTSFSINPKNKGDLPTDVKNNLSKNILRKTFNLEEMACLQRNINLPNDATIKAKLKETDISQRKPCFDEIKTNKPSDLSEMWERLTLVLDLAVTRLEETLADKIIGELKKSLDVFKQLENVPKLEVQATEIPPVTLKEAVAKMSHKEVSVLEDFFKAEIDESLQCDLVQNQVIDQLMLKLSVEEPKPIPTSTVSLKKLKKPQIVKDYFEILKPPAVESALIEVGRGDTVTVSTATAGYRSEEYHGLQRLKVLFSGPMSFIRENVFVITSVPTFFIVLLCLYGIIVIIMKPW